MNGMNQATCQSILLVDINGTPRNKTSKIDHLECKLGVVLKGEVQESSPSFWGSADMFVFEEMK